MSRRALTWLIAGLLLMAALGAGLISWAFERVDEEVEVGFRGAARWNRYLAAERLIRRLGYQASTVIGDLGTPSTDTAVIYVAPDRETDRIRAEGLLEWAASGGLLIVAPSDPPSDFSWLAGLTDDDETEPSSAGEDGDGDEDDEYGGPAERSRDDPILEAFAVALAPRGPSDERPVLDVEAGPDHTPLRVELRLPPRLRSLGWEEGEWAFPSPDGAFILRFTHGTGEVIVLSDADFLDNEHIGDHEHATFLATLLDSNPPIKNVSIVLFDATPSLLSLMARHAWTALVSGAVLLIAWIAYAGLRFGPLLPEPEAGRRSLMEHIDATAMFLWRHQQTEPLVESVRHGLRARLSVLQPAWTELPRKELVAQLAEASGMPPVRIDQALHEPAPRDPVQFLRTVRTLEELRKAL